jgi:DNA-binding phage protein
MKTETIRRDSAGSFDSREAILAWIEAGLETGDPKAIAAALNGAARANGLTQDALTAQSDIASVIETVKGLGFELTVKAG